MTVNKVNTINPNAINANLISAANKLTTGSTSLPPILDKATNITVSTAPADLDKLVAQLNNETSDTKAATAKSKLGSSFAIAISILQERANVAESNMKVLNEAKEIGETIDKLTEEIDDLNDKRSGLEKLEAKYKQEKNQLTKKVNDLSKQVAALEAQIAAETDPAKKAELEAKLANVNTELTKAKGDLNTATTNLASTQKVLGDTKQKIAEKMSEKDKAKERLQQKLKEIKDEEVLKALAEAFRMNLADVQNILVETEAKRSEDEEDWLEENAPARIIQRALDEIAEKTGMKI